MLSVFIGGAAMAAIFSAADMTSIPFYEHLVLGGFAFGAVFMATDPVTSARTEGGKWIFGLLVGAMAIIIRVMNNGISAPVEEMRAIVRGEKRKAGAGIGLYNINQRIKLMYGESYGLTFSCADGQTIVCVHLMDRKE